MTVRMEGDHYYVYPLHGGSPVSSSEELLLEASQVRWGYKVSGEPGKHTYATFDRAMREASEKARRNGGTVCYMWRTSEDRKLVLNFCPSCLKLSEEAVARALQSGSVTGFVCESRDCGRKSS